MTRGFLLGKFLPPHEGHLAMCEAASALVDELTVLVCTLSREPIPGERRAAWMRELLPRARVLHLDEDVPQEPDEHPDFWTIWRGLCRRFHPEPVDRVFGSEDYVLRLAAELEAEPVLIDPERMGLPVSGSAIRADPPAHWSRVPGPVRSWFQRRVTLFGAESTGKTTLAQRLAASLGTLCAPEHGRAHDRARGERAWAEADFDTIAARHVAIREAVARRAGPVLVEDTDPLLTAVWQEMLLGTRPGWADAAPLADLYLLCGADAPFVQDGTRHFGAAEARVEFAKRCEAILAERGARVVRLRGSWAEREATALAAIRDLAQNVR